MDGADNASPPVPIRHPTRNKAPTPRATTARVQADLPGRIFLPHAPNVSSRPSHRRAPAIFPPSGGSMSTREGEGRVLRFSVSCVFVPRYFGRLISSVIRAPRISSTTNSINRVFLFDGGVSCSLKGSAGICFHWLRSNRSRRISHEFPGRERGHCLSHSRMRSLLSTRGWVREGSKNRIVKFREDDLRRSTRRSFRFPSFIRRERERKRGEEEEKEKKKNTGHVSSITLIGDDPLRSTSLFNYTCSRG